LERANEEGELGVCGGFEGVAEVQGSHIDQGVEVDHRAERRSPQSTYRRGSSSLNDLTAGEAIGPYQNWHRCDCDDVSRLLVAEVPDREPQWLGAALTAVAADGRERYLASEVGG
jgi:hypothetical protein